MKTIWCVCARGCKSALKDTLSPAATQMKRKDLMLSEASQSQMDKHRMIAPMGGTWRGQTQRQKVERRGRGEGGRRRSPVGCRSQSWREGSGPSAAQCLGLTILYGTYLEAVGRAKFMLCGVFSQNCKKEYAL